MDELRLLFAKHGVEFDERYVIDLACFALAGLPAIHDPNPGRRYAAIAAALCPGLDYAGPSGRKVDGE
jgi:hypothetical protein